MSFGPKYPTSKARPVHRPGITRVHLPRLHHGQRTVRAALQAARFLVLACGRRWGKTRLGTLLAIWAAFHGARVWWIAPTYPVAQIGWRQIKAMARKVPGVTISIAELTVTFPSGGWIMIKSGHRPEVLHGEGLDLVIFDEAAYIHEIVWTEAIRPALADRKGRAIFVSTPKGKNYFYHLFCRGQAKERGWQSFQMPTVSNPFIDPEEVADAEATLPERVYKQEFLAQFLEDAGEVFRKVAAAAVAHEQLEPIVDHRYYFGLDWGKINDFTVIDVLDAHLGEIVYQDRFNTIDYEFQLKRLRALHDRFRPDMILAEENSIGIPLIERIERMGMPIEGFTTTNPSKKEAVEDLSLAIETGGLKLLPDPVLVSELQAFESRRLPSGNFQYSAPPGMHDDCVIGAMLAYRAWKHGETGVVHSADEISVPAEPEREDI